MQGTCLSNSPIQKLLIDDKKYYLFGRNKDQCDFPLDHQSCSRLHAALIYHKHLDRFFIMDLGSSEWGSRSHASHMQVTCKSHAGHMQTVYDM